jgi:hypothetical protein
MAVSPYYVALGDSMSIDLYPALDLEERGGTTARGGIGAASLFHRNDDVLWPAFAGRDLLRRHPGIRRVDRCTDGATIAHTLDAQLPAVPPEARPGARVVTVTAGGNDLLGGLWEGLAARVDPFAADPGPEPYHGLAGLGLGLSELAGDPAGRGAAGGTAFSCLHPAPAEAVRGYRELVDRVLAAFPSAVVILTTVYDPTDGTGRLPGVPETMGPLPMELLARFNDAVRAAAGHHRTRLADVHDRFLGHGLSAPAPERWYWAPNPIEPGARGASEIRRAWLDALEDR